ncbi:MAG: hypothetical protein IKX51_09670 [Bacteroidales bacterium]|nr:hypothetical protein [Bacteroidales bacterium]
MKHLSYIVLVVFVALLGKVHPQVATDSAAIVINRYLSKLGHDSLNWQTVDIKSVITFSDGNDTIIMERRFAFPEYSFVKLFRKGKVFFGLYSNNTEFLMYDTARHSWDVTSESDYLRMLAGYDIRGPLFNWENTVTSVKYRGISTLEGNNVCRVAVSDPLRGDREYLFEQASGNLFLTVEMPTERKDTVVKTPDVDWRAIHEYTPVGGFLFPTLESYQSKGVITIIASKIQLKPFKKSDFERPETIHEYY